MRRFYKFLISLINNMLKKIIISMMTSFINLLNKKLHRLMKEYIIYTKLKILISAKWNAFDCDKVINRRKFLIFLNIVLL